MYLKRVSQGYSLIETGGGVKKFTRWNTKWQYCRWMIRMTDKLTPKDFTNSDQHWMRVALSLAAKAAALGEVPVGAVVVRDGKSVGEGWNRPISGCDPTAHAEIIALRAAAARLQNYRLPNCTLYVTIEPCTMCAGAIVHSRIERVVFGAREPKAGAVVSNARVFDSDYINHGVVYETGVCERECSELISEFFLRRRQEKSLKKNALKMIDHKKDGEGLGV